MSNNKNKGREHGNLAKRLFQTHTLSLGAQRAPRVSLQLMSKRRRAPPLFPLKIIFEILAWLAHFKYTCTLAPSAHREQTLSFYGSRVWRRYSTCTRASDPPYTTLVVLNSAAVARRRASVLWHKFFSSMIYILFTQRACARARRYNFARAPLVTNSLFIVFTGIIQACPAALPPPPLWSMIYGIYSLNSPLDTRSVAAFAAAAAAETLSISAPTSSLKTIIKMQISAQM